MNNRGGATGFILGFIIAMIVVAGLVWWQRAEILGIENDPSEPTEVSLAAAEAAEAKIERLRSGDEPIRLSEVELASLFRYRAGSWATSTLQDPSVVMSGDTLQLSGMVPTDRLPSHPDLDRVRGLLPDTGKVDLTGRIVGLPGGGAGFQVLEVEFAGIPVPNEYYPPMLSRIGRTDVSGLPADALELRLPPGVGSVRLEDGYLVLSPSQ